MKALAVVLLASCAPTWTNTQRVTEASTLALLACDGLQTRQFLNNGDHAGLIEANQVLGEHPSSFRLWSYLAAIGVGVVVANKTLPTWASIAINGVVSAVEVESIAINTQYGTSYACGLGAWNEKLAEQRAYEDRHP